MTKRGTAISLYSSIRIPRVIRRGSIMVTHAMAECWPMIYLRYNSNYPKFKIYSLDVVGNTKYIAGNMILLGDQKIIFF
jgi:hypothetical protein